MLMASKEAIIACGLPSDLVRRSFQPSFYYLLLLLIPERRGKILLFAAALAAFLSQKQNRMPKDIDGHTHRLLLLS